MPAFAVLAIVGAVVVYATGGVLELLGVIAVIVGLVGLISEALGG